MTVARHPRGDEAGSAKPILIVAAVAVVAFVGAMIAARGGGDDDMKAGTSADMASMAKTQGAGCPTGTPDSSYSVAMMSDPSPPKAEGTVFHLTVRHDGRAVKDAEVCMTADMTEMHHEGINNMAREQSGGTYDASLRFSMRGPYAGTVIVTEPGRQAVAVPVTFEVD